jgi:hypothetical protein
MANVREIRIDRQDAPAGGLGQPSAPGIPLERRPRLGSRPRPSGDAGAQAAAHASSPTAGGTDRGPAATAAGPGCSGQVAARLH